MQRMGMAIRLRQEKVEEYKRLHSDVWPDVLNRIRKSNIRNYSIFLREPENLLFGYWEYHGSDFAADMVEIAQDVVTQSWWKLTDPCQQRLESCAPDEQWAPMVEVFHTE